MKLNRSPAPHIRFQENNRTIMLDVILMLLVLVSLATFYYGGRALMVCGVSVVSAALTDIACLLLRRKPINIRDFSSIVTGLMIALLMPATVAYYIVIISNIFAIAIVKQAFGGTGNNLFNPAAAGFSFAAVCWPSAVFSYPMPLNKPDVFGEITVNLYQNPSYVLKFGGVPSNDLSDMVLGNFAGPMGATHVLVILTCLLYLLYRKAIRWQMPVSFLATCAVIAFLFPRISTGRLRSVPFELMAGMILFGAVFMLTDPTTSPQRKSSLLIYGTFTGIITMFFRYYGGYEESMPFAILLSNALAPTIERYNERLQRQIRRKTLEARKNKEAAKA